MHQLSIEKKLKCSTAHVGIERYDKLTQAAIDLSATARRQISGSHFLKFIIDNYAEEAKAAWMETIIKEKQMHEDD
jgi:hypothetical protein